MPLKYIKRIFFGLFLFLILYLVIVWFWANSVAGDLLRETSSSNQITQLPDRHVEALIKIEDPTFYEHHGLDISNGQGLTTITSVVARNVFLGNREVDGIKGVMQSLYQGVFNCCKRIDLGRDVMALALNSRSTKQQQLNLFLEDTYFGSINGKGVIGFESAAKTYYGKSLSQLTGREFYGIIAMPLAPNYYHPVKNPEIHAERVKRIEAVVTGKCEADGWLDLTYENCLTEV